MYELFAVPLVIPWLSEKNLRRRFHMTENAVKIFTRINGENNAVLQVPHMGSAEALTIVPMLLPGLKFSVPYRPLDFGPAERYVRWARSHWGMMLISRKEGLLGLAHALGRGENVGVLFDQNTLSAGTLILSFGRICSATDLAGRLATRFKKENYLVFTRREGFLRAEFDVVPIENDGTVEDITASTTKTIEYILRADENACMDWLWAHNRWKNQLCDATHCLSIAHKSDAIAVSLKRYGMARIPRRQPYILRLPDNVELARIVADRMPVLREARPDVRWIVVTGEESAPLFKEGQNCERLIATTPKSRNAALKSLRGEWAEFCIDLEPGTDAINETKLCRAVRTVGLAIGKEMQTQEALLFRIETLQFTPEAYGATLDSLFKACGLGMSAR